MQSQLLSQNKKVEIYKNSIAKSTNTLQKNIAERDKLKKSLEQEKAKLESLKKTYGSNNVAVRNSEEKLKNLKEQYDKVDKSVENGAKKIQGYQTQLNKAETEVNKTTNSINKFNQEIKKQGGGIDSTAHRVKELGNSMKNVGNKISGVGDKLTTRVTLPLTGVAVAASKVGIDFEAEMSKVAAISGATGEDFKKLKAKAEEMGSKTKFSASEAGEGLEYMAMAGWKTGDMLDGIQPILNLAIASGEELGTTSDIVTDALSAFGLQAKDAGMFSDVLAAASSNANTNVGMMGETFKYAAPVAGALGYKIQDTALAIGLMANSGIKASQAGTALRAGLTNLAKPTDEMAKAMKKYGISIKDSHGKMKSFKDVMVELRTKLGHLNKDTQAAVVSTIFGKEAMSGWLAIINSSSSDFDKLSSAIDNSNGATEKMAKTMNDNAKGSIAEMKSALEESAIKVFEALAPSITKVANGVSDLANKFSALSPETQEFIVKAGLAAIALPPLISGIGKITSGAGALISLGGKLAGGLGAISKGAEVASIATTGMATAVEGTAIATGGATVATAGLGTALASVALPVAGVVAAIGGLGYATYKVSEKLSESATPAVDLFADKVTNATERIKVGNREVETSIGRTTAKISKSTKDAIKDYMDLDKSASGSLMNLRVNSDRFTKEAKDKVLKNFTDMSKKSSNLSKEQKETITLNFKKLVSDTGVLTKKNKDEIIKQYTAMLNGTKNLSKQQKEKIIKEFTDTLNKSTSITKKQSKDLQKIYKNMGDKIKQGLDKHREEDIKSLKDFFSKSNVITTKEESDILKKTTDSWNKKKKNIDDMQEKINNIIQKAADEHRQISDKESKDINELQQKMKENAVKTLSENEVQSKVILERMKDYDNNITAEQASEHIKQLNRLRDDSVKAANDECDKRIAEIIRMRDDSKVISADQADKLIEEAKRQRKGTVDAAEDTRKQAIEKITDMNSDIKDNVDTTTGEVLTNWQKFANWWDSWFPQPKTLTVEETGNSPNPFARRQYNHNWTGDVNFKGGYTTLHEQGWELYDLPQGTRIYNHESSEMLVKESAIETAKMVVKDMLHNINLGKSQKNIPNITVKTDLNIGTLNKGNPEDLEYMLDRRDRALAKEILRKITDDLNSY